MTGTASANPLSAVRDYVSDAVGCPADRITAVSRFDDGNRHAVYKVSYSDAAGARVDVVARISLEGSTEECEQAEREARVLMKMGGRAAPLLYDFRCASPWFETPAMCMQFVPGQQRDLRSATAEEIERLGEVVAWVHERPVGELMGESAETNTVATYAEDRFQSIFSTRSWIRDPLPSLIQARFHRVAASLEKGWERRRVAESFSTGEAVAALHGDIALGNVLWGPDPVLIDWEYTRFGDPADEIAYLFDQNGLVPEQREAFWRGYRQGSAGASQLAHVAERVAWWEPLSLFGSALWWLERWVRRTEADAAGTSDAAAPRKADYYFERVTSRLERLDALRTIDRA